MIVMTIYVELYFCKVPDSDCFVQQLVKNLDILYTETWKF